uniref:thrombospondin type-1 domain-containing protein 4-like isoform X2 n=1 Tax=Vespula vulgaris TaxID=7454 RepID=UPI002132B9FC|nr:thrombospondin type-1 domain-containing protein 4-like isoform X2 [Vespula vulgaris]XP_050850775.1 thrombospondin type-1 domain-containing protein 4-like isoform X2 [Vespula vulgaris]XP_050850776.1 thrombospondin type-1 domain-containing protein 4-like isoform X2 [Vespula vulgaris]XP_050850777.1 thrombospondin type-1 domain-containing protein 4-like isoform X2 [Vespula vulgaris]XP_050850778.1 thrombospondin type-1 domain-containing protein 4-like isoform X2 [Vespula vulgaris]XP_050850779.1 
MQRLLGLSSFLLLTLTFSVISVECHLIDGIFTEPTLEPGYNLVATVPRGAVALNVTELRHTQNYLAIRLQNGSYLLNGNYSINWSGEYNAAGTTFSYIRQSSQNLESFSAAGPLHEPIDVMVLYQEPNPGIVYRYIIPGSSASAPSNSHLTRNTVLNRPIEAAPASTSLRKADSTSTTATIDDVATNASYVPRRYKKRKFAWKPAGYTECNKSCGGGIQTLKYACVREHTQTQVFDKRCHTLEKPREIRLRCNTNPCPPTWRPTAWSPCSVSCGTGVRTRDLECVQEIRSTLTVIVSEGACMEPRNLPISEMCNEAPCEEATRIPEAQSFNWNVGSWSECSTTCGVGKRTRLVTCEPQEYLCNVAEKPISQEVCDSGPCTVKFSSTNAISSTEPRVTSQWLYTEWPEQCSVECGLGMQSRRVFCEKDSEEECDPTTRPETSRSCSSNRTCSGQWFVGPWSECSSHCDFGEQIREAVCVTILRGALRVVLDMNCPANKPETRKSCRGPPCTFAWFTSDWSECSRSCGKGLQKREVKCLSPENQSNEYHQVVRCDEDERPVSRRICNDYPCKNDTHGPENVPRVSQVQDDPEIYNGLEENPFCKDNIPNCALVIQARLCTYQFYQRSCCLSCSRAKHEPE